MATLKTQKTGADVDAFLKGISDEQRRLDCIAVVGLMREVTGEEPEMWGESIVGFGAYHYRYKSGREGDWFKTGVAPRTKSLTLYIAPGFDRYEAIMARLGRFKTGKSCLYVKKLADIDLPTLRELVARSVAYLSQAHR